MRYPFLRFCLGLAAFGLVTLIPARAEQPGLHVVRSYDLSGAGETGALCLDAQAQRLYAARGDRLVVLNATTGATLGTVSGVTDVRGLVVAPAARHGFATGAGNTITMFDTETLAVVKTVTSPGQGPTDLAYDADTGHVFVANRTSGDLAVFEASTAALVTDLPLGGKLSGVACDGFSRVFVTAEDRNLIHVVDSHTLKSLGDYPTAPGVGPTGLATEDSGRRLFVPCLNGKLVVIDGDVGAAFRILKLEGKGPAVVAFGLADPEHPVGDMPWKGRIVAVTADGTLNTGRMMAFVNYVAHDHQALGAKPLGVAIDGDAQRAFVLLAKSPTAAQIAVLEP
ncbi:MAG: YncE family protein [Opitutales bacterium]